VVGQGLSFQPGTDLGTAPPVFQLTGVAEACTVTITPLGQIQVDSGVIGSTNLLQNAAGGDPPGAPPPPLSQSPQQPPTIRKVVIAPSDQDMTPPAGLQAILQRDQFLTLSVKAQSPTGVPLYCLWTADGGTFSRQSEQPMTWDPV